uniref:Uncharacterized protein n=1 Tax=Octactis speculum TaxID=3111310 RepID=A0A7S2AV75_9STRA
MPGKVIGCRGVVAHPEDSDEWWFLVLDKDGDLAELNYGETAMAIEGGRSYKTHFERVAEVLPATPMDPRVKWRSVDYLRQLLVVFGKTDPNDTVLVLNRAEISEGAVCVQKKNDRYIATIATCNNYFRGRPTEDGDEIAVVNTFASCSPKGGTGDVGHLTSSFIDMAWTDQRHYHKTEDRDDVRYLHIKRPGAGGENAVEEWRRRLDSTKHGTTGGSKAQVDSDQAGDQNLPVAVSSMAFVNPWASSCYLKLKAPGFYASVCGNFSNVRNSRKLIRVKISTLASFYEYLFSTGVENGHFAAMPMTQYHPRLTVPLGVVRRRESEYSVVWAARQLLKEEKRKARKAKQARKEN